MSFKKLDFHWSVTLLYVRLPPSGLKCRQVSEKSRPNELMLTVVCGEEAKTLSLK